MSESFELSKDGLDKLDTVHSHADSLSESSDFDRTVQFLANYYLIREGAGSEVAELKAEKRRTEAERESLESWVHGSGRRPR